MLNNQLLNKMYYVPTYYYWLNTDTVSKNIKIELVKNLNRCKQNYIDYCKRYSKLDKMIEKTNEYYEYKSALIRIILFNYADNQSDCRGKELLIDIMNKWMNNNKISMTNKKIVEERTRINIVKCQKSINNIEDILMLISLQILENFYIYL